MWTVDSWRRLCQDFPDSINHEIDIAEKASAERKNYRAIELGPTRIFCTGGLSDAKGKHD
jgi:hypothetical protein